jgi:hypothetical protein
MKRHLFSVFASLVFAGALVAAQSSQAPGSQDPAPASPAPQSPAAAPANQSDDDADDKTLKGCLIQGSGPNVYILDNATLSTDAAGAKGQRYVVEISAPADQLKTVMNTHVQIVAAEKDKDKADAPSSPAPAGQSASGASSPQSEAGLPRLTAKRITRLAETCPAPSGD